MKKRKIFVGLLLGAAVFSLAACTGTSDNSTTSSGTTPATSTTSTDGTQGTSSTATTTTSAAAKERFTVKYYSVIGDDTVEITAAQQEVEEGSTTTAPEAKLAKDGYKITGYYTNDGLGEAFNFTTAINKNTKVYVAYEALTQYDAMATSQNKVVAYDFSDNPTIDYTTTEIGSSTPTLKGTSAENVKVENGAVTIAKDKFTVDFGQSLGSGIVNVYFELSFDAVKASEAWLQINGSSTTKSKGEVIGLRTNATYKLAYRLDSGTDITGDNASTIATKTPYKILATIDTANAKMSIKVNDTVIYENVAITANSISGLTFTAKSDGTSKKYVDNVAVTFEAGEASDIVKAKKAAVAKVDAYLASETYKAFDAKIQAEITTDLTNFKTQLNKATALDGDNGVTFLVGQLDSYIAADKYIVPILGYSAADTPIADVSQDLIITFTNEGGYFEYLLSQVSFKGYNLKGIYSDAGLTTKALGSDVKKNATLYAKLESSQAVAITEFKGYESGYNGWTVTGSTSTQKISATLGGDKNATDAVNCPKLDKTSAVTSPTFDATKSITLTMISSSTGTSNAVNVTVELLNGDTVVETKTWSSVTSGKVATKAENTFTSTSDFTSIRIKFKDANGDDTKDFGIYSITGTIAK